MTDHNNEPQLPDVASELLQVALDDLIATEADTRYKIDMGVWHDPSPRVNNEGSDNRCIVCLGGAVMAQSLNASSGAKFYPYDFEDSNNTGGKLQALNYFREGELFAGLAALRDTVQFDLTKEQDALEEKMAQEVTYYYLDPVAFKTWIATVIADMKECGL